METQELFASLDTGNGKCATVSSAIRNPTADENIIQFEPVFAPMTNRRGLNDELRPEFSLRVDKQTYVFGIDDVFEHGKRDLLRRPNNQERYGGPDYMMCVKELLLHAFSAYRGKDAIKPTIIMTVPIEQYNDPELVDEIKKSVVAIKQIEDHEGCVLRLNIDPKRVLVIPEASAAFAHYAYDAKTLNPRSGASTVGLTVFIDIGFLTTNVALFENAAYQKDRGFTLNRGGFGLVVTEVWKYVSSTGREFDISRVDRGLRAIAGIAPGKKKVIDAGGGVTVDVTDVYDITNAEVADLIATSVLNAYKETFTRSVIGGGGDFHLGRLLMERLPGHVVTLADKKIDPAFAKGYNPTLANALGAYTIVAQLIQKSARKGR